MADALNSSLLEQTNELTLLSEIADIQKPSEFIGNFSTHIPSTLTYTCIFHPSRLVTSIIAALALEGLGLRER